MRGICKGCLPFTVLPNGGLCGDLLFRYGCLFRFTVRFIVDRGAGITRVDPSVGVARIGDGNGSLGGVRLPSIVATVESNRRTEIIGRRQKVLSSSVPNSQGVRTASVPILLFTTQFEGGRDEVRCRICGKLILVSINGLTSERRTIRIGQLTSLTPRAVTTFINSDKGDIGVLIPFILPSNSLPRGERLTRLFRTITCEHTITFCRTRLRHRVRVKRRTSLREKYHRSFSPNLCCGPSTAPLVRRRPVRVPTRPACQRIITGRRSPLLHVVPKCSHDHVISHFCGTYVLSTLRGANNLSRKGRIEPFLAELTRGYFHSNVPRRSIIH